MKKNLLRLSCVIFISHTSMYACTLYSSPTFHPDINITVPSDYNGTIG